MSFLSTLDDKSVFVHACLQFFFLVSFLDAWDWEDKHLASEVLQKTTFAEIRFLMIPGSIFHDFWWPWTNLHDICCPGDWLEFYDFPG